MTLRVAGIDDIQVRQLVKNGEISNDFEISPQSRADRIRTCDLLTPSQTRYQPALRPATMFFPCHAYYSTNDL